MEDLNVPATTTTTTTSITVSHQEQPTSLHNLWRSDMACTPNCNFPMFHSQFHNASHCLPPHETPQVPYVYPPGYVVPLVLQSYPYQVEQEIETSSSTLTGHPNWILSNGQALYRVQSPHFLQPLGCQKFQEERILHSMRSKVARSNRKLARQRSACLKRKFSNGSSSSLPSAIMKTTSAFLPQDINHHNEQEELCTFCTPDKKKLRVLLKKELKNSDVGTPGRIVLPKREAEKNLPSLSSKEGIPIVIKDVYSNQEWEMRYRFWSNNKGRMYVLDNLGKFVENNGLESGDYITFYEDESKNLYFSISKAQKVAAKPTNNLKSASISCISGSFSKEALDEEDLSLQILIKEFEHREGSNSLMTSYLDDASSFGNCEQVKAIEPCSSLNSARMEVDDHQAELDNCFANLGTLLNLSN